MNSITATDICNQAIAKIGSDTIIASLDDNNRAARLCKLHYDSTRRALLRMHPWNFAIKRINSSSVVVVPAWGDLLYYPLPPDFIRFLVLDDQDKIYKVEAMPDGTPAIITDEATINVKYVYDCTNTAFWDTLFTKAMVLYLAMEIAYGLTQNNDRATEIRDEFSKMMPRARHVDATEDYPPTVIADEVTNVRIGPNRGWVRDPQT